MLRYYYDNALSQPFNGARTFGQNSDRPAIDYTAPDGTVSQVVGRWWAFNDVDESAATRACLIDNQGFVINCRGANSAWDLQLSYSDTGETAACEAPTTLFYADHPNFRTTEIPTPQGTTMIFNTDGTSPPEGFYAWTSTIAGDVFTLNDGEQVLGQRYVRFWDGAQFVDGIVGTGTVDNCPLPVANSVNVTLHTTAVNANCNLNGTATTLYYEPIGDSSFSANNVSAIYDNLYGPNSDSPSAVSETYIRTSSGDRFLWTGSALIPEVEDCPGGPYCGNPAAIDVLPGATLGPQGVPGEFRNDNFCVYQEKVCTDTFANNYQAADPPATISDNINECVYDGYTAEYTVTDNITGGVDGTDYTIRTVDDAANNGQNYMIQASVSLESGREWATAPDPLVYNAMGQFDGENINIPVTFTGVVQEAVAPLTGCNTQGSLNFVDGSDGSIPCYTDLGAHYFGSDDAAACGAEVSATTDPVYLATDPDGTYVTYDPDTLAGQDLTMLDEIEFTFDNPANGNYAKDGSVLSINNGVLDSENSGTCPVPELATSFFFTGPTNPFLIQLVEYNFTTEWVRNPSLDGVGLTVVYSFGSNHVEQAHDGASSPTGILGSTSGATLEVPQGSAPKLTVIAELYRKDNEEFIARTTREWKVEDEIF